MFWTGTANKHLLSSPKSVFVGNCGYAIIQVENIDVIWMKEKWRPSFDIWLKTVPFRTVLYIINKSTTLKNGILFYTQSNRAFILYSFYIYEL